MGPWISIHAPSCEGATSTSEIPSRMPSEFQSTPPRVRGRRWTASSLWTRGPISIHAPSCEGATRFVKDKISNLLFQSTPPRVRGRPLHMVAQLSHKRHVVSRWPSTRNQLPQSRSNPSQIGANLPAKQCAPIVRTQEITGSGTLQDRTPGEPRSARFLSCNCCRGCKSEDCPALDQ